MADSADSKQTRPGENQGGLSAAQGPAHRALDAVMVDTGHELQQSKDVDELIISSPEGRSNTNSLNNSLEAEKVENEDDASLNRSQDDADNLQNKSLNAERVDNEGLAALNENTEEADTSQDRSLAAEGVDENLAEGSESLAPQQSEESIQHEPSRDDTEWADQSMEEPARHSAESSEGEDDDLLGPLPSSNRGSTAHGSRPVTGFIDAEVAEIMEARQRKYMSHAIHEAVSGPRQRGTRRTKLPVIMSSKMEQESARLEREVRLGRQKLKKLEQSLRRRRASPPGGVVEITPEGGGLPQISPYKMKQQARTTKMQRTAEGQYEHKASRVAGNDENSGAMEEVNQSQDTGVGDATVDQTAETAEEADELDMIRGSLTILKEIKLSVFNKYWLMCKTQDLMEKILQEEEKSVAQAMVAADAELETRKNKKEKELKRLAEHDRRRAMKANRRQDVQDRLKKWAVEQCEEHHHKLVLAEDKARSAADAYHTLNEKLKWKDELSVEEQAELGKLRMDKRVAEIQCEKETTDYDATVQRTFVEAWRKEQERVRSQGSSLSKEQTYLEGALKLPTLFARNEQNPSVDPRMITNRIRSAGLRHAQDAGRDGIISLFQWQMKFETVQSKMQEGGYAFDLLDGTSYAGHWNEDGLPDGVGLEKYPEGFIYAGQVKEDLRHGLGTFFNIIDGVIYEGMWWHGKRHGFGVESHQLPDAFEPLPVAFSQYEDGQRKSTKRFEADKSIETLLLQRVRQVTAQAKSTADRCFELQATTRMPSSYSETTITDDASRPTTTYFADEYASAQDSRRVSTFTSASEFKSVTSIQSLTRSHKSMPVVDKEVERQKKAQQRVQKELKTMDLQAQRMDLDGIDATVSAAFKSLSDSTGKGFTQVNELIQKVGLNSGRLYSMTPAEIIANTPKTKPLEREDLARFLKKEKVPDALRDRIVEMYFETFGTEEQPKDNSVDEQERKILLKLSKASDWHLIDPLKKTITIRKRFKQKDAVQLPADLAANDLKGIIFAASAQSNPAPKKKKKRRVQRTESTTSGGQEPSPNAEPADKGDKGKTSRPVSPLANSQTSLAAVTGLMRAGSTVRANVQEIRHRNSSTGDADGLEGAVAAERRAVSRRNSLISLMSEKVLTGDDLKSPGRGGDNKVSQEKEQNKKGSPGIFQQEEKPVVITVPLDMTIEQAISSFDKDKYSYILVRPGTYRWNHVLEVDREVHILGEDGARLMGKWCFKASQGRSTFKNLTLLHEADPHAEGYQRMVHAVSAELAITECAILCPKGYAVWAGNRASVTIVDCIVAGSEDCNTKAAAGVVAMDFSRVSCQNVRIESAEECCVFADNDAMVKLKKCCLQTADVGVMLTDRAVAHLQSCILRLFRRGVFGEMRKGDTELQLRECTIHGKLFVGECQPGRYLKSGNKYLDSLLDYPPKRL